MRIRKLSPVVISFLVLSTFCLSLTIFPEDARATTLYVGGGGFGNYTTIQDAIDNATPGDTIYVYSGTYYENVIVNKTLNITGEDRDTTMIDGSGTGIVVSITADWVNITAFSLLNGSVGVKLYSSNHTSVVGNNISDNSNAIDVESSTDTIVFDNDVQNNGDGLSFWNSQDGNVANNTFLSIGDEGIELVDSKRITITRNTVIDSKKGIWLAGSNDNFVVDNNLSLSIGSEIDLDYSDNNIISNNTLSDNGLGLLYSNNNTIINNTLSANDHYIALSSSLNNTVLNNTMSDGLISIRGYSLGYWNTHTIDTSNTIKGRPVYYLKNLIGGTVPTDAGEVLLANCTDMLVENLNLSSYETSFLAGFSSDISITKSNFSSPSLRGIYLVYSDNITIGENDFSVEVSVDIEYSDNVTIDNNELLLDRNGIGASSANNLTIINNVAPSGRFSLYVMNLVNANISNNVASQGGRFELGWCIDCKIINNTFSNGGDILVWDSDNTTIARNALSYGENGIILDHSDDSVIANNTVSNKNSWGIAVDYASFNNLVVGNTVSYSGLGILVDTSFYNTVSSNNVSSSGSGIYIDYSSRNIVENNMISWTSPAIVLENLCHNNTIANNTASSSIVLSEASRNNIRNNTVRGISLTKSNENDINNNTISYGQEGISLNLFSLSNLVINNTISDNDYGVATSTSSHFNMIHHNSFIRNTVQASEGSSSNYWDNGYPSGGNYWSDYAGVDLRSGLNQDQIGVDGIGDTPYDIDQWTQDRYPLMTPYEMVHPLPPALLDAYLSGNELENVTISWYPSLDDGVGFESVIGYEIHRGIIYDPLGLGYISIASLPNGTSEFVDVSSGEGDPNSYFYRVCARDQYNNTKCAMNQAAKFTRSLSEGSNLVSTPLIQSNGSIESVLQTLKWDKAWSFDSSNQKWKWHMRFKPYLGDLRFLNHSTGVWVNVTEESNLTVAGIVPETTQISLRAGWNLVGFPSFQQDYLVADLKADVSADRVERFYPFWPPYHLRALEDFEVLMVGYGYWIKVSSDTTWTVNNT